MVCVLYREVLQCNATITLNPESSFTDCHAAILCHHAYPGESVWSSTEMSSDNPAHHSRPCHIPKLVCTWEFCLLMLSARHDASDVVPVGTTEHEGSFLKRSGNNCHLNVKSSGWECDGIRDKKGKHTKAQERYGKWRKLMGSHERQIACSRY